MIATDDAERKTEQEASDDAAYVAADILWTHTRITSEVKARLFCYFQKLPWEQVSFLRCFLWSQIEPFLPLMQKADREAIEVANERSALAFSKCGSPIEELFLAFCSSPSEDFTDWHDGSLEWPRYGIVVTQQHPVERFKLDFALISDTGNKVAVELDGHDFHERTKEQATRDKSRDRRLVELGWTVLRFTGSEVWKDPRACVDQAHKVVSRGGAPRP
jgi:very-short-patch-repair endonuclease